MQMISLTNPSQAKLNFALRRTNFASRPSPLNPLTRASASTHHHSLHHQTESTETHLSNLEKLLQKQAPPTPHENNKGDIKYNNNKGVRLLDGLDLARIWPEMKAAEDMSPRNLNHLQRLLSNKAPQYSPRNDLSHKWRDYHGCNDWEGLLDPLDENLRREVVRNGEFVQAAYHAFHSNPATTPTSSTSLNRHVALPDRSYKVTKSLYATSSVGLPGWVDDVAPDLGWMTQRSSWIGYVAVCDDKREIARMGRRDIVIALRGTATCLEWVENLRDILVRVPTQSHEGRATIAQQAKVECGFLSLYKTAGVSSTRGGSEIIPSLSESLVNEIVRLLELYKGENLSITITGHSLGAALALLAADELSTCIKSNDDQVPPIAVYSFGGPRVGNRGFATRLTNNGVKVLRVVNSQDVVTRVPGMFVSESVDKKLREVKAAGLLDALDNNMPWAYSHVGKELRVDSKMSPYLKPNADVACCHDLEAYLHLVDGFMSSNCPFRENAKRSLARLVHEQGSNVKKLYTSKAKALNINLNREPAAAAQIPTCLPSPS